MASIDVKQKVFASEIKLSQCMEVFFVLWIKFKQRKDTVSLDQSCESFHDVISFYTWPMLIHDEGERQEFQCSIVDIWWILMEVVTIFFTLSILYTSMNWSIIFMPHHFLVNISQVIIFNILFILLGSCYYSPCINGGTCIDYLGGIYCNCPEPYYGTYCEIGKTYVLTHSPLCAYCNYFTVVNVGYI